MIWIWSLAQAARPPGLDVDASLDTWQARSQALLAGPTGCWTFKGTVEVAMSGYIPSSRWTRPGRTDNRVSGPFTGRIEDGVWTSFTYELAPAADDHTLEFEDLELSLYPLIGRSKAEGVGAETPAATAEPNPAATGAAAMTTLNRVLDAMDPHTGTAFASWEDAADGVKLVEDLLLPGGRDDVISITTKIPGGGPVATELDIVFPPRVRVGEGLLRATLFDAQGHVRTQVVTAADGTKTALPTLESLSTGVGVLGFTVAYEQRLRYEEAARCSP